MINISLGYLFSIVLLLSINTEKEQLIKSILFGNSQDLSSWSGNSQINRTNSNKDSCSCRLKLEPHYKLIFYTKLVNYGIIIKIYMGSIKYTN